MTYAFYNTTEQVSKRNGGKYLMEREIPYTDIKYKSKWVAMRVVCNPL